MNNLCIGLAVFLLFCNLNYVSLSVDVNRKKQKSRRKKTITRRTMKRSLMRSVNYLFDKIYLLVQFNDSLICAIVSYAHHPWDCPASMRIISSIHLSTTFLSLIVPFTGTHEPSKLTCSHLSGFITQLVSVL